MSNNSNNETQLHQTDFNESDPMVPIVFDQEHMDIARPHEQQDDQQGAEVLSFAAGVARHNERKAAEELATTRTGRSAFIRAGVVTSDQNPPYGMERPRLPKPPLHTRVASYLIDKVAGAPTHGEPTIAERSQNALFALRNKGLAPEKPVYVEAPVRRRPVNVARALGSLSQNQKELGRKLGEVPAYKKPIR